MPFLVDVAVELLGADYVCELLHGVEGLAPRLPPQQPPRRPAHQDVQILAAGPESKEPLLWSLNRTVDLLSWSMLISTINNGKLSK